MTTIAGGMESDSESDDGLMLVSGGTETSNSRSSTSNDVCEKNTESNGYIINSEADKSRSNGRVDGRYNGRFDGKNNGRFDGRGSNKFRPHNRNYNRRQCLDFKSSQLLDDLRYAILQGYLETAKDILSKGIMVDSILKGGWTGLMYACTAGYPDIVSYLLENKADPNYHKDMFTPLMAVCASNKCESDLLKCCSLLLQNGARVDAHERHFMTPLMFSAREGYATIAKELLQYGADPDLRDNRGKTALAWAAYRGHGQIIRLLMEKGANVGIINIMGQSPADLAYEQGYTEIMSLLQKGHLLPQSSSSEDCTDSSKRLPSTKSLSKSFGSSLSVEAKNFVKVGELELFLSGIGMQDIVPLFVEHQLKFHDLLIMDDSELEKVGVHQVGVRKKILEACKAVHKKEWETSSIPNLKHCQYISCPDAVAMMSNIAKHLKYISTSVIYIRQQIQSQPRILELSQDSANVHNLLDEMDDSLKNVRFLNDELRFLKMHLEKVQDQVQFIPADLIVEIIPTNQNKKRLFLFAFGIAAFSAVITGLLWKKPSFVVDSIPTSIRIRIPFLLNTS